MAVTEFQQRVYDTILRIPRGCVATYAGVGKALGCRSPRAIGQALRRNPFAPRVPCHRVIATDLTIGGFNGATCGDDIARKLRLLEEEGVVFENGRLREPERVVVPV